ncbi:phenazine biosynthesis protein [Novosphingobium marinum]|uniref:Putative PhzF superfamily epimerase YddE/YHI9 n=1 Tax=Novosphingobium marinum TaxID=1514948 RepID=A0A7Z0BT87_9SPHN|nr:PhzF family phenazine biosynthesis protein [Novosphingobium marinum]NYH95706.1 putative PhzF superfamily epimerase YddE/YHI9 [Novosphingobium marinum]GGC29225.1 phenazine biosynthesis protein [Novosphingobium marinum]
MNRSVPYFHVDAFASEPFAGNQAAVMLLDGWPDDETLQRIAEENNFAETAFLVPDTSGTADLELRWFTPALEVRLCGHATLASGHVLLSQQAGRDAVTFGTRKAGVLEVRRSGEGYELALPAIQTRPENWAEAAAALGGEPVEVWRNPDGYNVFLYDEEAAVLSLGPDMRALAGFGDHQFIATARGTRTDVVSRVFVPGAGVDEDSVTGSAHAVLTPFWAAKLGRDAFTAYQASRRGGHLACRLDGERAFLGGSCVTVVEGRFRF